MLDYRQSRVFISRLGGRQWLSVPENVILLSTLAGTKHFPEIIFLFVVLASYPFNATVKAETGEARDCVEKILVSPIENQQVFAPNENEFPAIFLCLADNLHHVFITGFIVPPERAYCFVRSLLVSQQQRLCLHLEVPKLLLVLGLNRPTSIICIRSFSL